MMMFNVVVDVVVVVVVIASSGERRSVVRYFDAFCPWNKQTDWKDGG
jgi:hypothetical protein